MANFTTVVEDPSCRDGNVLGQVACADRRKIRGVESQKKHVFGQQKNIDKLWFDCLTINLQHVLDLLKFILDFSIGKSIWGIIFYYFLGTPHLGGNLLRLLDSQKSGLWHKAIISWARPVCEQ